MNGEVKFLSKLFFFFFWEVGGGGSGGGGGGQGRCEQRSEVFVKIKKRTIWGGGGSGRGWGFRGGGVRVDANEELVFL